MANIRLIKGRIKSAKNIAQITRAMELVAASKMRHAQAAAVSGKLYAQKIYEMVYELSRQVKIATHPLIAKPIHPEAKKLVIIISTNKGLCGGLNSNLFRYLHAQYGTGEQCIFLTLGKKGASFIAQMKWNLEEDFSGSVFLDTVPALVELATNRFVQGTLSGVEIVFSEFLSVVKQAPRRRVLLPLTIEGLGTPEDELGDTREFLVEPSAQEVFDLLLPHYIENQIRDAILQAEASEHSARMVAMRNATDNANAFIGELTLVFNKARQEKITYEITDMVTARMAVEE